MNLNKERVYVKQPQKSKDDVLILTPNEALMYNLMGIKLLDMTKAHNLTPDKVRKSRANCPMEGVNYGSLFSRIASPTES